MSERVVYVRAPRDAAEAAQRRVALDRARRQFVEADRELTRAYLDCGGGLVTAARAAAVEQQLVDRLTCKPSIRDY